MRIFGISLTTILLFLFAVWIGTKNPGIFAKVPVVNSL